MELLEFDLEDSPSRRSLLDKSFSLLTESIASAISMVNGRQNRKRMEKNGEVRSSLLPTLDTTKFLF